MVDVVVPSLPIIAAAAAIDAINPCVIGVMVLLLTYFALLKDRRKILITAIVYTGAVYIAYTLLGVGIFSAAKFTGLTFPFYMAVAAVAIFAGILEIKDFIWYGRWFSLSMPQGAVEHLERMARRATIPMAAVLGAFSTLVEFPCTGAPYLVIIGLLSQSATQFQGLIYLLFYNIIFVAPLITIAVIYYFGIKSHHMERWRRKYRHLMRLATGIFLVSLGLWMLYTVF